MRTMVLLASALLVGGTAGAQATAAAPSRATTLERDARELEAAATVLRDRVMQRVTDDSTMMNRATLGVTLGGAANKRDTLGVFVEAVAEDGPAERAGIFEGHRIAYINNIDVRSSAADAGDSYLSGVGRHRLMKAMREVKAGNTVTLRVWTGSGYRDVQLAAGRYADVYKNQRFGGVFEFAPGASFRPALQRMRIEAPVIRRLEARPAEGAKTPTVRATPAPKAPRAIAAPSLTPTPRPIAPVRTGVRRYTI